jgi:transposase
MSRAYSLDLRERVVTAVEKGGLSARRAAVQFGVDASTTIRWVGRLRRTGSVRPSKIGGYHGPTAVSTRVLQHYRSEADIQRAAPTNWIMSTRP